MSTFHPFSPRRLWSGGLLLASVLLLSPLILATEDPTDGAPNPAEKNSPAPEAEAVAALAEAPEPIPVFERGLSGALTAAIVDPGERAPWHVDGQLTGWTWQPVDPEGEMTVALEARSDEGWVTAPEAPGAYRLARGGVQANEGPVLFVRVPFDAKQQGRIDRYAMGTWPGERGTSSPYALPSGFVRMTQALSDVALSPRLQLGNFKTKNQYNVWPKYLAFDMALIDKLELIASDLRGQGLPGNRLFIMSGFRTPSYNAPGVGAGGRAQYSRHVFGDAADVWVDDDENGRMDDLNGDGRSNTADARVMLAAQERVEASYPSLVGGAGVYKANAVHGPFLHVDVRGTTARWGLL